MATNVDDHDLAATLLAILRDHGTGILDQRSRLQSELRARAPHSVRGVHLLMTAFDAGVPLRLREAGSSVSDFKIGQETAQIVDNFGAGAEPAREAVQVWAQVMASLGDLPETVERPAVANGPAEAVSAAQGTPISAMVAAGAATVSAQAGPLPLPAAPATTHPGTPGPQPSAAPAPPRPKPLPLPTAAKPGPLPLPGGTLRPLPLPAAPAIQPLPGTAGAIRPLPLPGALTPPSPSSWKWAIVAVPLVLAGIGGALWSAGTFDRPVPATDPAPSQTGGMTDEGHAIADVDKPGQFKAQQIDGNPNTLLFTFGLRSGTETYTYQAAVGFDGTKTAGAGLIKAVKRGQEASTGSLDVAKVTQSDGYVGFTISGKLGGPAIGAPSICVSALAGKSPDKLDVGNGGGGFCAFATSATGVCDGNVKLGCGDLVP